MTEPVINESTTAVMPEKKQNGRSIWQSIGIFFTLLGLLVMVCAFTYGYVALAKVNRTLAKMVFSVQAETAKVEDNVNRLQQAVTTLQADAQKNAELAKEQAQIMADWKAAQQGDLAKWQVAEAQYLVKLANDQLQFSHNAPVALTLLTQADQKLQNITDPQVVALRQSLTTAIGQLQSAPTTNSTDLYLKLSALNTTVDQLPLPEAPLAPNSSAADGPLAPNLPWWKWGAERAWQALHQIVIVRKDTSNNLPLVLPDEKIFLYQNLHAQLEQALWAVLNRNQAVYQASLARAAAWVDHYFLPTAKATQVMQQGLKDLLQINLQPPTVDLSATLQQFDTYLTAKTA